MSADNRKPEVDVTSRIPKHASGKIIVDNVLDFDGRWTFVTKGGEYFSLPNTDELIKRYRFDEEEFEVFKNDILNTISNVEFDGDDLLGASDFLHKSSILLRDLGEVQDSIGDEALEDENAETELQEED